MNACGNFEILNLPYLSPYIAISISIFFGIVTSSATSLEEYCKRAVELGHGIISSLEHGWQGHYIECHQLAAKYNLKFLFGVEAYWVKDRFYVDENGRKDGANCHICLLAMNENGRQE